METNYQEIKERLSTFGKAHGACHGEYKRLLSSESIEEVMSVVRDNFSWCCRFRDFADILITYRDQFAQHKIWINASIEIREGSACLLTTEGEFHAESWGNSTIHAVSRETSTIHAESWGNSTIILFTSTIECQVNDGSIARYIPQNRIVYADASMKFDRQ